MLKNRLLIVLFLTTVFSISMGFLESAVVVYLREIYYPSGFSFPINPVSGKLAITEVLREIATILMLFSAGMLAGSNTRQRIAVFLYCFAIWDIFYYIFLKLLIDWPESLFTWDILFLIPIAWTGPVIAPVIISCTMILLAYVLWVYETKPPSLSKPWLHRTMLLAGSFLVFLSFIWDFSRYMLHHHGVSSLFQADMINAAMLQYAPRNFNWLIFFTGELIILVGIYKILSGSVKTTSG